QPLSRETALSADAERGLRELAALRPIVIDESDDSLDSFRRATELGYSGTSHKNCNGIFKSLHNRRIVCELNREAGEERYFQSAEDLANLPIIPLQQDLAAVAALGIPHVERNGHHYFRGLDHLPPAEAAWVLKALPDLYQPFANSARLLIRNGSLNVASLQGEGFGYACELSLEERLPLEDWSCSM
ncbi:MAG: mandelate racemase, partial [Planctomycetes bacterium]|nr:mandelate racemase [Planctomycetota bacterium]